MYITQIEKELLMYVEKRYIENGYMYNGHVSPNSSKVIKICKGENPLEILYKLVKKQILEKRDCVGLSFALVISRRKKLIKKHNLAVEWEKDGACFYPNDEYGEVTQVMEDAN